MSSDFITNPYSSIVDAGAGIQLSDTFVKVLSNLGFSIVFLGAPPKFIVLRVIIFPSVMVPPALICPANLQKFVPDPTDTSILK